MTEPKTPTTKKHLTGDQILKDLDPCKEWREWTSRALADYERYGTLAENVVVNLRTLLAGTSDEDGG